MTEQLRILSIDPATACGFAHSCGISGVWNLSIQRDESAGMRLIRLRGKLTEIKASVGVDLLVYEAVRYAPGGGALVVAGEIQGLIKTWCLDNNVECKGYSSTQIKKHATGNGSAKKPLMVAAAQKIVKRPVESDDEADAICLLACAREDLKC